MRSVAMRGLVIGMMVAALMGALRAKTERRAVAQASPLEVTLVLERTTVEPGAVLSFTIRVRNTSTEPVTVTFATAQRFDLYVASETIQLDKWSRGRTFGQVVAEVRWLPGETVTFTDLWLPRSTLLPGSVFAGSEAPLGSGAYRVAAELTGQNQRPLSPPVYLIVGQPAAFPQGCTTLTSLPPAELPIAAVASMVEPRDSLHSVWQRTILTNTYLGFNPRQETLSDLQTVNRRNPVTICLLTAARVTIP